MLPQGHPLSGLVLDPGFKVQEVNTVIISDISLDMSPVVRPQPDKDGLLPLRNVIPYTEGRALPWKLIENCLSAKARNWPTFKPFEFHKQTLVLCGGGPSLWKSIPEIRALQKSGAKVMAINRTHDYLLDLPKTHGIPWIKPWAGIILEAIPQAAMYMRPTTGVRYYVASQCSPETFDQYEKLEHFIWHAETKKEMMDCLTSEERKHVVPAMGSTCGLRAMLFGYMLGFTDIRVFGLDSSYDSFQIEHGIMGTDGSPKLHSYAKPESIHDIRQLVMRGFGNGEERRYWANGNMAAQADEFQKLCVWRDKALKQGRMDPHRIIIHGEGLIPDMAREFGLHADRFTQERKAA